MRESIKKELQKRKVSASLFAKNIGIRQASLTEYLSGRKELNSNNIEKICGALGLILVSTEEKINEYSKNALYERMILEIPVSGLTENGTISKVQLASYAIGLLAAKIATRLISKEGYSYQMLEKITFKGQSKSLFSISGSLIKMSAFEEMFDEKERELLSKLTAEVNTLGNDDGDDIVFISSFVFHLSLHKE